MKIKGRKKGKSDTNTAMDWLPVKSIKSGIMALKNGSFVKLIEVQPINFLLRSKNEQKSIIYSFREFLKACLFPMQISIQSLKADISRHTSRMKEFRDTEKNDNARELISAYIDLIEELQNTEGVKRRFYISFPFVPVPGVNTHTNEDVQKQLEEKAAKVKSFIKLCGNYTETPENEDRHLLKILYSCLNKRAYEIKKLSTGMDAHLFPVLIGKTEEE
ncbi:MAG: hypothetical protein FIA99_04345 [Ruminiclostridium sp.]|nr:hypothetical protein [Ruminiclostridium sp.]